MSGCLSLFAGWLPRGFPHEASSERVSCETATPPHDGLPPPPYEASSLPKGFSSRENLPSGIKEFYNPSNSTIEYVFSYITLKKAHTKFAIQKDCHLFKVETGLSREVITESFKHRWSYTSWSTSTITVSGSSKQAQVSTNNPNRTFISFSSIRIWAVVNHFLRIISRISICFQGSRWCPMACSHCRLLVE